MRILLLAQVVPYPPDSGPKIKTHYVLRYLAQHHEVHLISFVRSAREEADAQALRGECASITTVPLHRSVPRDCAHLVRSLVARRPFLVTRDESLPMRDAVRRLTHRYAFDAAHADQLSMAQFALDLPVPLRVLDEHNAVWTIVRRAARRERGLRRLLAEMEWRKLRAYEGEMCRRFDRVTVVSEDDEVGLREAAGAPFTAHVIPIAVDTNELAFAARTSEAYAIVSVATMYYPPNVEGVSWFASEVFPLVRRRVSEAEFLIVGSRPPGSISRLASRDSGITVTGYVADLEPLLSRSAVLVVPVRSGSGMRVKILDAFARGIPVVSTTVGVEGIDARPGEHLLVADSPADFANAVVRLLQRPDEAARLAGAARVLVEARYDWRTALQGLDEVYRPLEGRRSGQVASAAGDALPVATARGQGA